MKSATGGLSEFARIIDDAIEALVTVRDIIGGDPDLEDDDPAEDADPAEDGGDTEPSLGWAVSGFVAQTFDPDRELDPAGRGEREEGL